MATKEKNKASDLLLNPGPPATGGCGAEAAAPQAPHLDVDRLRDLRDELIRLERLGGSLEMERMNLGTKIRGMQSRSTVIRETISAMVFGRPGELR